ncbi:alkaline phosphatase D family protein [Neolewinella antarctica]|uniref:Alkaline phosphatase D n=1 Tax=Neolewinella antarctica TaxID=442734 RepID=A0ABX0XDL5_9BACT|nr:alkaline phosphatase D family protein [Neolewinella antarctica]NJC27346.1 alkaline phosphatase D [Neolewinella antarctica]
MRYFLPLLLLPFLCTCASAPSASNAEVADRTTGYSDTTAVANIQSGPMLGYNELREVLIWVQLTAPAEVKIAYTNDAGQRYETETTTTERSAAHTAKLVADQVQPGEHYTYEVVIDGVAQALPYPTEFTTQSLWRYRGDAPDFTVAIGSCTYVNEARYDRPGKGYGNSYDIFTAIDQKNPDLMLWLGDNMYLREPDWSTRTGYQHRYTHTRSLPEMQPLLARTHHYAIWDDHDYGPNNSDRSWRHRDLAKETFDQFWGNPTSGLVESERNTGAAGITTKFRYNDVDFFLLDNRSFRTPNDQVRGDNKTLLGRAQLDWLIESLVFSDAPWKMVCVGGQVLNTAAVFENYVNLAPEELWYLLARISEENISGVVFLTGDRHHTELSEFKLANGEMVYDVTISPLTAGVAGNETEDNKDRVEGTFLAKNNFGLLSFTGPESARRLVVETFGTDGELAWRRELR